MKTVANSCKYLILFRLSSPWLKSKEHSPAIFVVELPAAANLTELVGFVVHGYTFACGHVVLTDSVSVATNTAHLATVCGEREGINYAGLRDLIPCYAKYA